MRSRRARCASTSPPEGRALFDRAYDEALSVALASGAPPERMLVGEYPLGDMPLIVLTRGKNADEGHQKPQADLVRLSRNSKQIVARKSGHHIQLDEPELVTDAIRQIVDATRRRAKLTR